MFVSCFRVSQKSLVELTFPGNRQPIPTTSDWLGVYNSHIGIGVGSNKARTRSRFDMKQSNIEMIIMCYIDEWRVFPFLRLSGFRVFISLLYPNCFSLLIIHRDSPYAIHGQLHTTCIQCNHDHETADARYLNGCDIFVTMYAEIPFGTCSGPVLPSSTLTTRT